MTHGHRRDEPLSNTAPVAKSGRVSTLEGLAALRSNGRIADEEVAAEKTDVVNNSPDREEGDDDAHHRENDQEQRKAGAHSGAAFVGR